MKQRRLLRVLCGVLLLSLLLSVASACAPRTSDIALRVEWLLTQSAEINDVIWGKGLPVLAEDSDIARENHIYDDFEEKGRYLFVADTSPYISAEAIKEEAERYYAKAFLEKSVYPQLFDGIVISDGMGSMVFARARFYDDGERLYQSTDAENYLASGKLIYDFSTLKVVAPSNKNTCHVRVSATVEGTGTIVTQTIKLERQNNQWFLSSFAG